MKTLQEFKTSKATFKKKLSGKHQTRKVLNSKRQQKVLRKGQAKSALKTSS
jgi:hypothetical protein